MIIDISKVAVVPKGIPQSDSIDYICTCSTCTARLNSVAKEKSIMQDAMRQVEEALQNTPLISKDISLQFLNTPYEINFVTIEQLHEYMARLVGNEAALFQTMYALSKFSYQFNKKYRHPLVCMLHDNNLKIIENLGKMSQNTEYQTVLARINGELAYLRDQQDIISELFREKFLSEKTLITLFNKTDKAILEAKARAQSTMEAYYSQPPQTDLSSHVIVLKPGQKMA